MPKQDTPTKPHMARTEALLWVANYRMAIIDTQVAALRRTGVQDAREVEATAAEQLIDLLMWGLKGNRDV